MIDNEKNNRELVFTHNNGNSHNNEMPTIKKKTKDREMERNTFSMEPLEKRKSKIHTTVDVAPYLQQQQSYNEKENFFVKKENSTIPKLTKLPSKKLDRKNSIEKCFFLFLRKCHFFNFGSFI